MSLQNLLQLPLDYLLKNVSGTHWVKKHRHFPASNFFLYDPARQRLRLRVEGEYINKPRLCAQLKADILEHRTVQLKSFLWQFIEKDLTIHEYTRPDDSLIQQFQNLSLWKNYDPSGFRTAIDPNHRILASSIPKRFLKRFWSATMLLQARAVWYRVISRKVPTTISLQRIKRTPTNQCRLCHEHTDTLQHFLVQCPIKKSVWINILQSHFPTESFNMDDVLHMLLNLETPMTLRSSKYDSFAIVISTTLWYIWYYYWQFIINDLPFQNDMVISKIEAQISILQTSPAALV
jgi:hypothetical protein